ncbi:MAG: tyrosine-type recombinase/integrase [Myxococcales bacterium]|nr:tyrosine-type recombinase/integrase [Myxococcales bacterium]
MGADLGAARDRRDRDAQAGELELDALPQVLYVRDFAKLLRISSKALRHRVARGQVPTPFRLGRALVWTREAILDWLRDCDRAARRPPAKIAVRPYANDPARWHVDIRVSEPGSSRVVRRRLVAPAGLGEDEARRWGEARASAIVEEPGLDRADAPRSRAPGSTRSRAGAMTLTEFYESRFEPEHVRLQKPATQDGYSSVFRGHIGPLLGSAPLAAIDDERVLWFRAQLHGRMRPSSANTVLGKLGAMLRFARRARLLESAPEVRPLPTPRARPKRVYSDLEIAALVRAAGRRGEDALVVCLLALDMGLRVSEICALEWADVDLERRAITIQNNTYRGRKQTPKGVIGTIAMTGRLARALTAYQRAAPPGPLVLYRESARTGSRPAAHTDHSIRYLLNLVQDAAGLERTGPHMLRHTALTRLARLGASVYEVQAVARHARLETTQAYLHMQQVTLTRDAARRLDRADAGATGELADD